MPADADEADLGGSMATRPLPDQIRQLLEKPNPAVMVTLRASGQPVSVATWYVLDGDRILVNLDQGRKRLKHLRRDPRVAMTVLDGDDWYTHVSVQGRVAEIKEDPDLIDIDRIARHYTGNGYQVRSRKRISAWIEIDRWHGWGAAKDAR
jgi:PPOX class probable F420-dependent enzyme